MTIPRSEHPRPQFVREHWLNLNGEWTFRLDSGKSGSEQDWQKARGFENKIVVPFCPESKLSGVAHTDFIEMMWYHRTVTIPAEWDGKMVLLNFGGVDYECEVFLDGELIGAHTGGSTPFSLDLTGKGLPGKAQQLVVKVKDDLRSGNQPMGKQAPWFKSRECSYTRTTGIWQTVWLEAVDAQGLKQCRITPDFDNGQFIFTPVFHGVSSSNKLSVKVLANGKESASCAVACANGVPLALKIDKATAWEPGNPFLYDVVYEIHDRAGKLLDRVESYAGMRKIHIEGKRFFLNNKPLFVRFVLDQGFYEDGLWTAPSDETLRRDIELSMNAGFNGARLHQKVFEERFHYWADRMGYLTWAEYPSWGLSFWQHFRPCSENYNLGFRDFLVEWANIVERDYNHPSIIAWTPLNETRHYFDRREHVRILRDVYDLTRMLDPTRPVNTSSGYIHVKTDIWSVHHYAQSADGLAEALKPADFPVYAYSTEEREAYHGQPYVVDEYGGVKCIPAGRVEYADNSWGYGEAPGDEGEALDRIRNLTACLLHCVECSGYCYTQLTDIEQEQNGIFNYDRTPKFDMEKIRKVFSEKPDWSAY